MVRKIWPSRLDSALTLQIVRLIPFLWLVTACADGPSLVRDDALFRDEFAAGQMGDWVIEGDEVGRTAVTDQQLFIEIDAPNVLQYTTLAEPTFANFVLEVDVKQVAGHPESSFGVLFRMQGPEQFYRFDITGTGLYMIERRDTDGTWSRFVEDWTETPAINQGLNVPNRLKVEARGPALAFYVNEILLQRVNDQGYAAGTVALDAGTFGHPGLRVAFDNVVVKRP